MILRRWSNGAAPSQAKSYPSGMLMLGSAPNGRMNFEYLMIGLKSPVGQKGPSRFVAGTAGAPQ